MRSSARITLSRRGWESHKPKERTGKQSYILNLAGYRSTPHSVTGVSPAKLLFGREMRTKVPSLTVAVPDQEAQDRDFENKGRSKLYADARRGAKQSDIQPGDQVLVKRAPHQMQNKLDTPYLPEPHHVVSGDSSHVTVESLQVVQYERNPTHLKRYHQEALPEGYPTEAMGDSSSSSPECAPIQGSAEFTNRPVGGSLPMWYFNSVVKWDRYHWV